MFLVLTMLFLILIYKFLILHYIESKVAVIIDNNIKQKFSAMRKIKLLNSVFNTRRNKFMNGISRYLLLKQ